MPNLDPELKIKKIQLYPLKPHRRMGTGKYVVSLTYAGPEHINENDEIERVQRTRRLVLGRDDELLFKICNMVQLAALERDVMVVPNAYPPGGWIAVLDDDTFTAYSRGYIRITGQ